MVNKYMGKIKKYTDKMTPRQRLVSTIAALTIGGAAIISGCRYTANRVDEGGFFNESKRNIATLIDQAIFKLDPGAYLAVATYGFYDKPEVVEEHKDDLNNFAYLILRSDPGTFVDLASGVLREQPSLMQGYEQNLTNLVLEVDTQGMLTDEGQVYLFESNASKVAVKDGIQACETGVFSRASEDQKLKHTLTTVEDMSSGDYLPILKVMFNKSKNEFFEVLKEAWPW